MAHNKPKTLRAATKIGEKQEPNLRLPNYKLKCDKSQKEEQGRSHTRALRKDDKNIDADHKAPDESPTSTQQNKATQTNGRASPCPCAET